MVTETKGKEKLTESTHDRSVSTKTPPSDAVVTTASNKMESTATEDGGEACESKVESHVTPLSLKETDDSSDTDTDQKEGGNSSVVDVEEAVANPSTEVTGVKLAGDKKRGVRKANPAETAVSASAGGVEPETDVNDEGLKVASLEKARQSVSESTSRKERSEMERSASDGNELPVRRPAVDASGDVSWTHTGNERQGSAHAPEAEHAGRQPSNPRSPPAHDHSETHSGGDQREITSEVCGGDSLRQHQWNSKEEALLLASRLSQQADREALQRVVDEKVKVQAELSGLKQRCRLLEDSCARREAEELSALRDEVSQRDARIEELEAEVAQLRRKMANNLEAKVKDLQRRLVTLANIDTEKDNRIKKLEEDLRAAKILMLEAESRDGSTSEKAADLSSTRSTDARAAASKSCAVA